MSPQRDLAYNYPLFIYRALQFLDNPKSEYVVHYKLMGGTEKELQEYALKLASFIRRTADLGRSAQETINTAWVAAGLTDAPCRVKFVFGAAFFNVSSSAYFQSMGEANSEEFQPFSFMDPEAIKFSGTWGLLGRMWRRLTSWFGKDK